jgi:hypothetical protein
LRHSNPASAIKKRRVLAAKWVFLEWFAQVCQAGPAVETLWKLFFAKKRRAKLGHQETSVAFQKSS